jgi:hypothetical protein
MRVCYHIQSHRDPEQITRLVRTLLRESPNALVHISHDRRGPALDAVTLHSFGDVVIVPADGGYGDFSHVDRHMQVIEWLLETGTEADWLVNITGQDYPIRPIEAIERELAASDADAFLEFHPGLGDGARWPAYRVRSRYYFRHHRFRPLTPKWRDRLHPLQALNFGQPLVRFHVAYGLMVGRRVRSPFSPEFPVYGGSAFMSLRRSTLEYLQSYFAENPAIVEHFRHTLSPVEAVFPTILANSAKFKLIDDSKRYFDFRGSQFNHPKLLTRDDLPRAFATGAHFARKIDWTTDPDIFDIIDAHRDTLR